MAFRSELLNISDSTFTLECNGYEFPFSKPFFTDLPYLTTDSESYCILLHKLIPMEIEKFNCFTIGVGGQGVISATHILADAALTEKFHVRTAETHGMAQRGGSVSGYLRFGTMVNGPLIPKKGAQIIISLELSEVLRSVQYANENTHYFINITPIMPLSIYQYKNITYPSLEEVKTQLQKITPHVHFIDATSLAKTAGNDKAINVILLGMVAGSGYLPITREILERSIAKFIPPKALELNRKAFQIGFDLGQKMED